MRHARPIRPAILLAVAALLAAGEAPPWSSATAQALAELRRSDAELALAADVGAIAAQQRRPFTLFADARAQPALQRFHRILETRNPMEASVQAFLRTRVAIVAALSVQPNDSDPGVFLANDAADLAAPMQPSRFIATMQREQPWTWAGWTGWADEQRTAALREGLLLLGTTPLIRRLAAGSAAPLPKDYALVQSQIGAAVARHGAWPAEGPGPFPLGLLRGSAWRSSEGILQSRLEPAGTGWVTTTSATGLPLGPLALAWPLLAEIRRPCERSPLMRELVQTLLRLPLRAGHLAPGETTTLAQLSCALDLDAMPLRDGTVLRQCLPEWGGLATWWTGELCATVSAAGPEELPEFALHLEVRPGADPRPLLRVWLKGLGDSENIIAEGDAAWRIKAGDEWRRIVLRYRPGLVSLHLLQSEGDEVPPPPRRAAAQPFLRVDLPAATTAYYEVLRQALGPVRKNAKSDDDHPDERLLPPRAALLEHLVPWVVHWSPTGLREEGFPLAALWLHGGMALALMPDRNLRDSRLVSAIGDEHRATQHLHATLARLDALRSVQALGNSSAATPSAALRAAKLDPALLAPLCGGRTPDAAAIDALGQWRPGGTWQLRLAGSGRDLEGVKAQWVIPHGDEGALVLTPYQALWAESAEAVRADEAGGEP